MSYWSYTRYERAVLFLASLFDLLLKIPERLRTHVSARVIRRTTLPCTICGSREVIGHVRGSGGFERCALHASLPDA